MFIDGAGKMYEILAYLFYKMRSISKLFYCESKIQKMTLFEKLYKMDEILSFFNAF